MCLGLEPSLIGCPASPIGTHNCIHEEDAGVQCALTGKHIISVVAPVIPTIDCISNRAFHKILTVFYYSL